MENVNVDMDIDEFIDVETPDISALVLEGGETSSQKAVSDTEDSNSLPDDVIGKPPELDYDSIGEFCFESEELALKGNTDYKNILEAMVVLEAQKAKAVKDLERLKKLQEEALSDPFEFVERLKRKENMNFPAPQKIYSIPVVDWSKYAVSGNPSTFCQRQMALIAERVARDLSCSKMKVNDPDNESRSNNLSWAVNEEKQLSDLLVKVPKDENEEKKCKKISSFQNHTPTKSRAPKEVKSLSNEENEIYSGIDFLDGVEINPDLKDSPEYQEFILLNKVLREKLDSTSLSRHMGYKCCRCKVEPIVGVRWHCIDCKPPLSVDFCNDCKGCLYEIRQHTANHKVERIHASKAHLDRDYMQFLGSDYNYLDPNYMPAT